MVETGLNALKGAELRNYKHTGNDENFFLTYGDGLSDINIQKLLKFHLKHKKIFTITGVRPSGRFGELKDIKILLKF